MTQQHPQCAPSECPDCAPTLTQRLQQKCSDWGTYWRAPDAHGVVLSIDQALELLRDALGVEVEIADGVQLIEKVPPVKNPMAEWPWESSASNACVREGGNG